MATVGELLQLKEEHNVSHDGLLRGESSGVGLGDKLAEAFVSEINLRAGESTVVLRIGSPFRQ